MKAFIFAVVALWLVLMPLSGFQYLITERDGKDWFVTWLMFKPFIISIFLVFIYAKLPLENSYQRQLTSGFVMLGGSIVIGYLGIYSQGLFVFNGVLDLLFLALGVVVTARAYERLKQLSD